MYVLHSIRKNATYGIQAIFEIPINSNSFAYMKYDYIKDVNDDQSIVIVDAKKFLELWKAEPYNFNRNISHGNCSTWPKDYKFSEAERGFSKGFKNPVPLANIVCNKHTRSVAIYEKKFFFLKKLLVTIRLRLTMLTSTMGSHVQFGCLVTKLHISLLNAILRREQSCYLVVVDTKKQRFKRYLRL